MDYDFFMGQAIDEAKKAFEINEVPIGCVIVYKDEIIGRGYNRRNTEKNSLYHAEIIAINEACKNMSDWRLEDCTLFVTIEPCSMCAGAIVQARIKEVVFGTRNNKAGSCGSVINLLQQDGYNHQVLVTENILKDECANIVKEFFNKLRQRNK